jgi:anti-sigma factor RsiW
MTCREFRDLFVYLAFGDLSAEHRQRIEGHLQTCPACAAEWRDYREITRLAQQLPATPLPAELENRLQELLVSLKRSESPQRG